MKSLRIASVSDLHLGHKKNNTSDIVANLKKAFPDNAVTGELDIIFLVGDVFDGLLNLPSDDVDIIDAWIHSLLNICARHDIILRILEGTPSHDWKQSRRFIHVAEMIKSPVDVKYITELSIEYINKFDINVLYIPDEWRPTTDKTLIDVHDLLKAKGLTQVDYAVMHGAFKYQLPEFIKASTHDAEEYLKIVREFIFIGHVHEHTRYKRIIAQGSFDRLAHGTEGPKGHVRVHVSEQRKHVVFVENKTAKIFKTIDCTTLNLEDTLQKVRDTLTINEPPPNSYIRILADIDNPILSNMSVLISQYPLYMWSKLVKDNTDDVEEINTEQSDESYTPITITRDNIVSLLLDRVSVITVDKVIISSSMRILNEVL